MFRWSVHFKYPIYQYTNDDTDYKVQRNPHINQGAYISFSLTVTFGLIARMCCFAHLIHYKRFCDVIIKIIRTCRDVVFWQNFVLVVLSFIIILSNIHFNSPYSYLMYVGSVAHFGNCCSHNKYRLINLQWSKFCFCFMLLFYLPQYFEVKSHQCFCFYGFASKILTLQFIFV